MKLPGPGQIVDLLVAQAEALAELPAAMGTLTRAVRGLTDEVNTARDTLARMNRVAVRAEGMLDELEQPIRALAPGLQRLAVILDDEVMDTVPDTLRRVTADVMPVLKQVRETQERVVAMAATTEQLLSFVQDTGSRLTAIPGAGLLGFRTGRARPLDDPAGPTTR